MKALAVIGLATVLAIGAGSAADARQGCGAGFHRNFRGRCVPNARARVVWVTGRYYPGRGYWSGTRWYHHRYRWHNGWRYR